MERAASVPYLTEQGSREPFPAIGGVHWPARDIASTAGHNNAQKKADKLR